MGKAIPCAEERRLRLEAEAQVARLEAELAEVKDAYRVLRQMEQTARCQEKQAKTANAAKDAALRRIRDRAREQQRRLHLADQSMPVREIQSIGDGGLADAAQEANGALSDTGEGRVDLLQTGVFDLHSGGQTTWKIDCDALTDDDLATAASLLSERTGRYGSVEGVPTGGLRLAEAFRKYQTEGPLLIVDDVLTTGASMEEQRAGRDATGAVIFARGRCPPWVTSLFTVGEGWLPPEVREQARLAMQKVAPQFAVLRQTMAGPWLDCMEQEFRAALDALGGDR